MSDSATPARNNTFSPVFGDYCQTRAFTSQPMGFDVTQTMQAYCSDPVLGLWSASLIKTSVIDGVKVTEAFPVEGLQSTADFCAVIDKLAQFEVMMSDPEYGYTSDKKEIQALGYAHYKAFAEREGFLFDELDIPRLRPHAMVLPEGRFTATSIEAAARHFDGRSFGKGFKTLVEQGLLGDTFNRTGTDVKIAIKDIEGLVKQLDYEERYVHLLSKIQANITEYVRAYSRGGKGSLLRDALEMVDGSRASNGLSTYADELKGIKYSGASALENFNTELKISILMIHARALYRMATVHDQSNRADNLDAMGDSLDKVYSLLRKRDKNDPRANRKELETQAISTDPDVPPSLDSIIKVATARLQEMRGKLKKNQLFEPQPAITILNDTPAPNSPKGTDKPGPS